MRRVTTVSTRTDTLLPYTTLFLSLRPGNPDRLTLPPRLIGGDPPEPHLLHRLHEVLSRVSRVVVVHLVVIPRYDPGACGVGGLQVQETEEHTSELQSLMRISYAVFCLNNSLRKLHTTTSHNL